MELNDTAGYKQPLRWARDLVELAGFDVERTGSYGAGLSRFLQSNCVWVVEVSRTKLGHQ